MRPRAWNPIKQSQCKSHLCRQHSGCQRGQSPGRSLDGGPCRACEDFTKSLQRVPDHCTHRALGSPRPLHRQDVSPTHSTALLRPMKDEGREPKAATGQQWVIPSRRALKESSAAEECRVCVGGGGSRRPPKEPRAAGECPVRGGGLPWPRSFQLHRNPRFMITHAHPVIKAAALRKPRESCPTGTCSSPGGSPSPDVIH